MLILGYPVFEIVLFAFIGIGLLMILYILITYVFSKLDKEVPDDYFDSEIYE